MPVLETLEQRALFRLTRFLAFVIILCLTIALAVGAVFFTSDFFPNQASHVSYETISAELRPGTPPNSEAPSSEQPFTTTAPSQELPFVLQPYFSSAENRTYTVAEIM